VIASSERVVLRDRMPSDVDARVRWTTQGEWCLLDAPWEGVCTSMTPEQEAAYRERFLEGCGSELPTPRTRAVIAAREGRPLGWVSRYAKERFVDACFVGINICEDACLNRGYGTEALRLWVDYVFFNLDVHRIGLDTWSFNPRMMHVAEKAGFAYEGAQRELIRWEGEWLDMVHFGMLRREWEEQCAP
jgi:RimJ/RimL family protein N-acetyltransferase